MIDIDLSNLSRILLESISNNELDKNIRKKILDNIKDEHYDIACNVFNQTSQAYFNLGLKICAELK